MNAIIIDKVSGLFYILDFKVKELIELSQHDFTQSHDLFKKVNNACSQLKISNTEENPVKLDVQKLKDDLSIIHKNLQYNDIIHQRLLHIQQVHNSVIGQILMGLTLDKSQPNNDALKIIRKVSELSVNQLMSLSQDYNCAFEVINNTFRTIKEQMLGLPRSEDGYLDLGKAISYIEYFNKCLEYQNLFALSIKQCIALLQSFSLELILDFGWKESDAEIFNKVEKLYTMESERVVLNNIANKVNKVSQLISTGNNIDLF